MKGQSCHCPIWPSVPREHWLPMLGRAVLRRNHLWGVHVRTWNHWLPQSITDWCVSSCGCRGCRESPLNVPLGGSPQPFVVSGSGMGRGVLVTSPAYVPNYWIFDWLGSLWIWIFSSVGQKMDRNHMINSNASEFSDRWHVWADFINIAIFTGLQKLENWCSSKDIQI